MPQTNTPIDNLPEEIGNALGVFFGRMLGELGQLSRTASVNGSAEVLVALSRAVSGNATIDAGCLADALATKLEQHPELLEQAAAIALQKAGGTISEPPDFECMLCHTTEPDPNLINGTDFCEVCTERLVRAGIFDESWNFIGASEADTTPIVEGL